MVGHVADGGHEWLPYAYAGRADLVRALAAGGDRSLYSMARVLNYELVADSTEAPGAVSESAEASPIALSKSRTLAPIPFWQIEHIDQQELDEQQEEPPANTAVPIGPSGVGRQPGSAPKAAPLASPPQLWRALRRRLASGVPSRQVDVEQLIVDWSRGRLVRRVPFCRFPGWTPSLDVLVDRSDRLIPFWKDQDRLVEALQLRLGRTAVREHLYLPGMPRPWWDRQGSADKPALRAGVPVLVVGDLGFAGGRQELDVWTAVAALAKRFGAPISALVPIPPERWNPFQAQQWAALDWQRPAQAPRPSAALTSEDRRARAERLLTLLSFAVRIDPGLLRTVRRLLPADQADAGTEADAWAMLESAFTPAADMAPERRHRLQERFGHLDDAVKAAVVEAMRTWRAGRAREIWLTEVLGLAAAGHLPPGALRPEEVEEARQLWHRLAATVQEGQTDVPPKVEAASLGFILRNLGDRLPGRVWRDPELKWSLWRAWSATQRRERETVLPREAGLELLGNSGGQAVRWTVRQRGGALVFGARPLSVERASYLGELYSAGALVAVYADRGRFATPRPLTDGTRVELPHGGSVRLRTDRTTATLRRLTRPPWARAIGRDSYGLWAAFEVQGVEHRLRWIPPGRFLMGSPPDEPGRFADEGPRHPVVIEHGFWLGETPCTQDLWEVVMGDNPSRFKSARRPVEQVSWDDCQEFCRRLDELVPGLEPRLPTEAEWEYACRAGTTTGTYAGPIQIRGEHDAPVLHDIAWYGGNSGVDFDLEGGADSSNWPEKQIDHQRAGTRLVGQKQPNPWGLHDTLGNVFEWCLDPWRADYKTSGVEGSSRVGRGGSWCSHARDVRAACRRHSQPSFRWLDLGFRLARGQVALQPGAEPQGAERPGGEARRGTRRRSRRSATEDQP